jgi:anti-sigma B factor antagonist
MNVEEKRHEGVVVLSLEGRLDSNTSDVFEERLFGILKGGEHRLVLDFQNLDYISSAGLRVLLKTAKELKRVDGRVDICAMKDYVREVFEMSGFVTFLPIHVTLEDSLKAIRELLPVAGSGRSF